MKPEDAAKIADILGKVLRVAPDHAYPEEIRRRIISAANRAEKLDESAEQFQFRGGFFKHFLNAINKSRPATIGYWADSLSKLRPDQRSSSVNRMDVRSEDFSAMGMADEIKDLIREGKSNKEAIAAYGEEIGTWISKGHLYVLDEVTRLIRWRPSPLSTEAWIRSHWLALCLWDDSSRFDKVNRIKAAHAIEFAAGHLIPNIPIRQPADRRCPICWTMDNAKRKIRMADSWLT